MSKTRDERRETREKQLLKSSNSACHCEERSDAAIQNDFKMTEVGMIPWDWEAKTVVKFADITTGNRNTQDAVNDGLYPFYVRSQVVERINSYSFDAEGVVTAGDGVGTGKIFHYVQGKFGLHQRCYLMYNFRNVATKYFYWIFSQNFYERVNSMTAKSSVDSVRREMIADMLIPLPPTIEEQQRIANALSDVDSLISNLEKLIAKKKNIKQGAMQQLLTGRKRLPGFGPSCHPERSTKCAVEGTSHFKMTELGPIPSDWNFELFGKLVSIYRGGSPRPIEAYITTNPSGVNWIKIGDVEEGAKYITSTQERIIPEGKCRSREVHEGDFILSNSMSFGRPYILKVNGCIHDGWLTIQDYQKTFDTDFLYYMLSSEVVFSQYVSMAAGSSVQNLNKEKVAAVKLYYPSSKAEQTAIANVLSDMDSEIQTLETKLAKYRKLKTGMMQQLLTGKIRLV